MNLIICGSRSITDYAWAKEQLDRLTTKLDLTPYKSKVVVFCGGADGADKLAEQWAWERRLSFKTFPVSKEEWKRLGKKGVAASFAQFEKATPLIAMMKEKYMRKGESGKETVECPVCKGFLTMSISSYNWHVWGHCQTKDCLSWME